MFRYLRAAFLASPEIAGLGKLPVNLVGLLGAGILGVAFPWVWPLGLALETVFLFGLATNRRFQKYVDAHQAQADRQEGTVSADLMAQRLLSGLPDQVV